MFLIHGLGRNGPPPERAPISDGPRHLLRTCALIGTCERREALEGFKADAHARSLALSLSLSIHDMAMVIVQFRVLRVFLYRVLRCTHVAWRPSDVCR